MYEFREHTRKLDIHEKNSVTLNFTVSKQDLFVKVARVKKYFGSKFEGWSELMDQSCMKFCSVYKAVVLQ